ncbi:glycosyltransferase [bacterium]|nr:glycosyltransferase [bacterium]
MNILFVNTRHYYGGGDSTYTFNLAELLKRNGHQISFFAMKDQKNLYDINEDLFVSHIDFKDMNRNKSFVTGLRVASRAIYSVEARKKFSVALERINPDIVHLHNIHCHITPSIIFEAKKRKLPVVWTLHDYKMICPNASFLVDTTHKICEACGNCKYYQTILKRCKKGSLLASTMACLEAYFHRIIGLRNLPDLFLAPSSFLMNKLLQRGFWPKKVIHLPLLLPDKMFECQGEDLGYFLFFARLEHIKGIFQLIEACHKAPEITVKIAGRLEDDRVKILLKTLPKNVEYLGMQQGDTLRNLISSARAIVLPSLWYENQPFSITEAFAAGKPVIASDLGGMKELVENFQRGILVAPGDTEGLVKAMNWMKEHSTEARAMGERAREYALREHSGKKHYERIMLIYRGLLDSD